MWVLCSAVFLDSMGVSLMSIAVPSIQRGLQMPAESAQWILSGYTVAFGGMLLFGGRLTDVLGSRLVFLIGISVFAGGGIVSGLGGAGTVVICGRILSGIGAALVAPASLAALLARFATPERRAIAIRAYSASGAVGYGAGLIVSGALTSVDWRVTVLLPAGIAVALFLIGVIILPHGNPRKDRSLNLGASVLVTAALLAVVFVIATVPSAGWTPPTISALVLAVGTAALFVSVERGHRDPLLPHSLLRSTALVSGNVLAFLWAAASIGWQFAAALFLSDKLHFAPLTSGLAILPLAIMIVLTQTVARNWMRQGNPASIGAIGMVIQGAGILWFLLAIRGGDYWTGVLPGVILHGIGNGLTFPTFYTQSTSDIPDEQNGIASALVNTSVQIGSGIGVAVTSALITAPSSYAAAFVAAATFSLLGGVWAALRLRRPQPVSKGPTHE